MVARPGPPSWFYTVARENLGSVRRVYLRGNRIVRRGDLGEHPETVLLLHGFFQTRNVWELMEDRLRWDGFGVFSFDLGGLFYRFNTRSPEDLATSVAEKVERVCQRYGLDRIHVVGHSKGGLVARHYVQFLGGDRRVKSLITLGTPHHGTSVALAGIALGTGLVSRSPWDLLPGSAFTRRLSESAFPPGIPLVSIRSTGDLLCPARSATLRPRAGETSMKNLVVQGVGHTALTYDPGVYRLVRAELEAASRLWAERAGLG